MWVNIAEFDKPIPVLVKIMMSSYRYQPSKLQQSFPMQNDRIGTGSRFLQPGSMATVAGNTDPGSTKIKDLQLESTTRISQAFDSGDSCVYL